MVIQDFEASPHLAEFIRKYQVVRLIFGKNEIPPIKYHAPRAEHTITFYVRDPQRFSLNNESEIITYPACIINGIYNIPILRYGAHDFWAIKVIMQPSALFRLTGMPNFELTNTFIDAETIWCNDVKTTNQLLNSTDSMEEMLVYIEDFLEKIIRKAKKEILPIDKIGNLILNTNNNNNNISIEKLADESCLSKRQFYRKFEERNGVSPTMLNRIARFERSFRFKNKNPELDWLSIAMACGYHDYQHLAKEYKDFTLFNPTDFYKIESKSPERVLGTVEI